MGHPEPCISLIPRLLQHGNEASHIESIMFAVRGLLFPDWEPQQDPLLFVQYNAASVWDRVETKNSRTVPDVPGHIATMYFHE